MADLTTMLRSEPDEMSDALARRVIGASIEVHECLGPAFAESVYEEALCVELALRKLQFARQVLVAIDYKGTNVGHGRLDLLVEDKLVVELKAVESLAEVHVSQVLAYLRASKLPLGLLINFNVHRLKAGIRRVVNTPQR